MSSEPEPIIDHPAQPGWQPGGLSVASPQRVEALQQHLAACGEGPEVGLQAVDLLAIQLDSYRLTHERDNVGRLRLGPLGMAVYEHLAGRPEHFSEYIHWFGAVATRALLRRDHAYAFNSMALELAGCRQLGYWDAARQLDTAVRRIPEQFRAMSADIAVRPPEAGSSNYRLHPLYDDVQPDYRFRYAGVRHRQPVLDIREGYYERVWVYRQAVGLLVLGQLEPEARRSIVTAYEAAGPEHGAANNTPAATIAGRVFERALADWTERAIIPIGTQYIMRVGPLQPEAGQDISQPDQ